MSGAELTIKGDLSRYRCEEHDVLVLEHADEYTEREMKALLDGLKRTFPGVRVIVLPAGAELTVVNTGGQAQAMGFAAALGAGPVNGKRTG